MNINKQKPKTVVISFFDNLDKKNLIISILALIFSTDVIDILILSVKVYYLTCKLKKARVFIVAMKNLKFQSAKEVKLENDLKTVVLENYYNFLDVFSKKHLDILCFYQKYDYKIILKEIQNHSYAFLYKMSL